MNIEYPVQIIWSQQDGAYLAISAELAGCVADGPTPEEALANFRVVVEEWIETAKLENRPIPKPMTIDDFARLQQQAQDELRKQIENQVKKVVHQILTHLIQSQPSAAPWHIRTGMTFDVPEDLVMSGGSRRR